MAVKDDHAAVPNFQNIDAAHVRWKSDGLRQMDDLVEIAIGNLRTRHRFTRGSGFRESKKYRNSCSPWLGVFEFPCVERWSQSGESQNHLFHQCSIRV
jgi:hypothetical protein